VKDSSIQTYTWWIGVYLRQLNGESPSQENAVKFLEVMKADHRQNTVSGNLNEPRRGRKL